MIALASPRQYFTLGPDVSRKSAMLEGQKTENYGGTWLSARLVLSCIHYILLHINTL